MIVLVEWLFWKYTGNQIRCNDILCMECIFEVNDNNFGKCMYEDGSKRKTSCGSSQIL